MEPKQDARRYSKDIGDIFPDKVINVLSDWICLKNTDVRNEAILNKIVGTIIPFISFQIPNHTSRLYYKRLHFTTSLKEHLFYIISGASNSRSEWKFISHERLSRRLLRPIEIDHRKNSDIRTAFRWKNIFIVKKMFSTGTRYTDENEFHVIQVDEAPLLYFQRSGTGPPQNIRTLDFLIREDYEKFVLHPKNIYLVRPDIQYALLAAQKSIFALDRCDKELIKQLKFDKNIKFRDPKSDKDYIPSDPVDIYDEPPSTPYLTRDYDWEKASDSAIVKSEPEDITDNEDEFQKTLIKDLSSDSLSDPVNNQQQWVYRWPIQNNDGSILWVPTHSKRSSEEDDEETLKKKMSRRAF